MIRSVIILAVIAHAVSLASAQPPLDELDAILPIFDDAMTGNFARRGGEVQEVSEPVHTGSRAMRFASVESQTTFAVTWNGRFTSSPYQALMFWVHGGETGGQTFRLLGVTKDDAQKEFAGREVTVGAGRYLNTHDGKIPAQRWARVCIPLADLGIADRQDAHGFKLSTTGTAGFLIDDLSLVADVKPVATVTVSPEAVVRPVPEHVFGIATYSSPKAGRAVDVAAARDADYRLHRVFYPTFNMRGQPARIQEGPLFAEASGLSGEQMMGVVNFCDQDSDRDKPGKQYGTAPEAASFVAWANVSTQDPAYIKNMTLGVDNLGRDWGTVRDWVDLRRGKRTDTQIAGYDFKHMSLGREKPFHIRYWELDNEPWLDVNNRNTDFKLYAQWVAAAGKLMKQVDPSTQLGLPVQPGLGDEPGAVRYEVKHPETGETKVGFVDVVLTYLSGRAPDVVAGRFVPDFWISHNYVVEYPNLSGLDGNIDLAAAFATQGGGEGGYWQSIKRRFDQMSRTYYGDAAKDVPIYVSEVHLRPKMPLTIQMKSVVSGIFMADTLGAMLEIPGFAGATIHDWYDQRYDVMDQHDNPYAYGWRNESPYAIYANESNEGSATRYPIHYAVKLLSRTFARSGDDVVEVSSDNPFLQSYAIRQPDGTVNVLLINKSNRQQITGQLEVEGFGAGALATVYAWGMEQDRAEDDISFETLESAGLARGVQVPPYSMRVVSFTTTSPRGALMPPRYVDARSGAGKVSVSWSAVSGADAFDVYRSTDPNAAGERVASGIRSQSWVDADVTSGQAFYYRVASRLGDASALSSSSTTAAQAVTPPAAPAGIETLGGDSGVRLTWSEVERANNYIVERASQPAGPFEILTRNPYKREPSQELRKTYYLDRDVINGQTYYYRVRATIDDVPGEASDVALATAGTDDGWTVIETGRAFGRANDAFGDYDASTGKWVIEGSGESWYNNGEAGFLQKRVSGDFTITARLNDAGPDGRYGKSGSGLMASEGAWDVGDFAQVGISRGQGAWFCASGGQGSGMWTELESGKLKPDQLTRTPVWLRLQRNGNEIGAFRSSDGQNWERVGEPRVYKSLGHELHVGIFNNTGRRFAAGRGEFEKLTLQGDVVRSVAPLPVTQLRASRTDDGTIRLQWDAVAGAVGYQVLRWNEMGAPTAEADRIAVESDRPAWTDMTAKPGESYRYEVVAIDASGRESEPHAVPIALGGQVFIHAGERNRGASD